jgi:hypothetical protein
MSQARPNFIIQSLLALAANGVSVPAGSVSPALVRMLAAKSQPRHFSINAVGQALRRLERRGLVRRTKQRKTVQLSLTQAGELGNGKASLDDLLLPDRPTEWDGRWRIVLFSIPESLKDTRTLFRRKLQAFGFRSLQRSAWLYPFPCESVVNELIERLSLTNSVSLIVTGSLHPDDGFLDHFELGVVSTIEPLMVDVQDDALIPLTEWRD